VTIIFSATYPVTKENRSLADKGYFRRPNRTFLHLNGIKDGIMRKDSKTAKLTKAEIGRNKKISKKRYIRFQPVGFQTGGWNRIFNYRQFEDLFKKIIAK